VWAPIGPMLASSYSIGPVHTSPSVGSRWDRRASRLLDHAGVLGLENELATAGHVGDPADLKPYQLLNALAKGDGGHLADRGGAGCGGGVPDRLVPTWDTMKLESRISFMGRNAWKQCRS
jgi:hypothetical protein